MSDPKNIPVAEAEDAKANENEAAVEAGTESVDEAEDTLVEESTGGDAEGALDDVETDDIEDAELVTEEVEPQEVDETDAPVDAVPAEQKQSGSGFIGLLAGGGIAAALGAGAMWMFMPSDQAGTEALEIAQQARKEIKTVEVKLDGMAALQDASVDIEALQKAIADQDAKITAFADQIASMTQQVEDLAKRPLQAALPQDAVKAYEGEVEALQNAMAQQRAEVEAMLTDAQNQRETAALAEITAKQVAALSQLQSAIQNGSNFAPLAQDLNDLGVVLPELLLSNVSGIPTAAQLAESFPDAARSALAASRRASDETGVSAFFRDQLGVRSLTPQEGTSTNAILSRAEDAMRNSDVSVALNEIMSLPEEAASKMQSWADDVQLHLDALGAVNALISQQNSN